MHGQQNIKEQCISIRNIRRRMLRGEVMYFCLQESYKHLIVACGENLEFLVLTRSVCTDILIARL